MYKPKGNDIEYKAYFKDFERLMKSYDGRPHWAKAHDMDYNDFDKVYPELEAFCEIKDRMDPTGMFTNEYIARCLTKQN